jgi:hypothetical protein
MLDRDTARKLIKPHMPVVCSNDGEFAAVDHLEGSDTIKLTRDESGRHHYIPLDWVTRVDDKVHIDRPADQAKEKWFAAAPEAASGGEQTATNSTEEMRGQPLAARVAARKAELEAALADLGADESVARVEIEHALAVVASLSTGDLAHPSAVVGSQLSDWLEHNKYLGMKAASPAQPAEPAQDPPER